MQHLAGAARLDHMAGVHHSHMAADLRHDAQVVGDHQYCGVAGFHHFSQQLQNLRLQRDIQRRRRFVRDQQPRTPHQCHRDQHALTHAAGELVRVVIGTPGGVGDADALQHLHAELPRRALALCAAGLCRQAQHLGRVAPDLVGHVGDLVADPKHRVQVGRRVLEDHADGTAAQRAHRSLIHGQHILTVEQDLPLHVTRRRCRQQPRDRQAGHRLAAAGLTGQAPDFALVDLQLHAIEHMRLAFERAHGQMQVMDVQQAHRPISAQRAAV